LSPSNQYEMEVATYPLSPRSTTFRKGALEDIVGRKLWPRSSALRVKPQCLNRRTPAPVTPARTWRPLRFGGRLKATPGATILYISRIKKHAKVWTGNKYTARYRKLHCAAGIASRQFTYAAGRIACGCILPSGSMTFIVSRLYMPRTWTRARSIAIRLYRPGPGATLEPR
jgi:hypothetical protein